jgi:hypothetical protein
MLLCADKYAWISLDEVPELEPESVLGAWVGMAEGAFVIVVVFWLVVDWGLGRMLVTKPETVGLGFGVDVVVGV